MLTAEKQGHATISWEKLWTNKMTKSLRQQRLKMLQVYWSVQNLSISLIIIIIIHEFHGDTSLKQNFRGAVMSCIRLVSMLLLPLVCVVVWSAKQFRLQYTLESLQWWQWRNRRWYHIPDSRSGRNKRSILPNTTVLQCNSNSYTPSVKTKTQILTINKPDTKCQTNKLKNIHLPRGTLWGRWCGETD